MKAIKKQMGECDIPVNVSMRGNELKQLKERFARIRNDFNDFSQADQDFEGD